MLTLKKVKELVEAPSHAKRTPSPKMLFEEGIVLLRREFDQGSHLTVYNSGYVLFSAGKRNTVFHIHDCCGDYAYDAAEGKGDVIKEEYFENCEWHMHDYGYLKDDVFPLTKEGAREWHRLGERIYPLFRDGTVGDYVSQEGIEQHDGIFGIRADAWDAILPEQREDYAEDEYGICRKKKRW